MEESMNEFCERQVRLLLSEHGYPLHINTPYCEAHLKQHKRCRGCESYHGCEKGVEILKIMFLSAAFPPQNLKEAIEASELINRRITEILKMEDK